MRMARRDWLRHFSAAALVAITARRASAKPRWKSERAGIGLIGCRYQGTVIGQIAKSFGDVVAIADVDRHVREQARASFGSTPTIHLDYRDLLNRPEVDVVMIGAPDHWHAKMAIDALAAGKHLYCEKPLTLTIAEGRPILQTWKRFPQTFQVGSWQRSDHRFRLAVEMVHQGRIGKLQRVDVVLGKNEQGGPFDAMPAPKHFDWERWQGQAAETPYIPERSHYTFRWWREYAGGQLTDWGAHHIDIALWAIGEMPNLVEAVAKWPDPSIESYNVPTDFQVRYEFPSGVQMEVLDEGRNGILFTGSEGRIFVNRGTLEGTPVDQLTSQPLPREAFRLYQHDNLERPERVGKLDAIQNHIGNFFDLLGSGNPTISDPISQHASAIACHLGNIACQVGRPIRWDDASQTILDDPEAQRLCQRPQRAGYEVKEPD